MAPAPRRRSGHRKPSARGAAVPGRLRRRGFLLARQLRVEPATALLRRRHRSRHRRGLPRRPEAAIPRRNRSRVGAAARIPRPARTRGRHAAYEPRGTQSLRTLRRGHARDTLGRDECRMTNRRRTPQPRQTHKTGENPPAKPKRKLHASTADGIRYARRPAQLRTRPVSCMGTSEAILSLC